MTDNNEKARQLLDAHAAWCWGHSDVDVRQEILRLLRERDEAIARAEKAEARVDELEHFSGPDARVLTSPGADLAQSGSPFRRWHDAQSAETIEMLDAVADRLAGKRYPRAGCPECNGSGWADVYRSGVGLVRCPSCMTSPKPACVPDGAPWSVSVDGLGRDVAIWWDYPRVAIQSHNFPLAAFTWIRGKLIEAPMPEVASPALAADCKAFYEALKKDGGL